MARRRKPRSKRPGRAPPERVVTLELDAFEVTRGYDGPLRGKPELALVVGAYRVGEAPAQLVGRGLVVQPLWGSLPLVVAPGPEQRSVLRVRARLERTERLAILALALEQDSGADITDLYGALEYADDWRLWEADAVVPSPGALDEVTRRAAVPSIRSMHAIVRDRDLAHACRRDDLVGILLAVRSVGRWTEDLRLPFLSPDARNEWTVRLRVTVR